MAQISLIRPEMEPEVAGTTKKALLLSSASKDQLYQCYLS
jgi:hypothetical protein